jgi:hypothetical protein
VTSARFSHSIRAIGVTVLLLVPTACGGGGGGDTKTAADGKYGSDLLDEQATTTLAPRATAPKAAPQTPQTIIKKRSGSSGSSSGGGSDGNADISDPIYGASRKATGGFAGALLRPAPKGARKIVYQLLVQNGKGPDQATVNHVVDMLRRVSGKTVDVPAPVELPGGPAQWTTADLHTYADQYGKVKSSTDAAVLNVLFVKGRHKDSESILGVATRADVLTMFPDQYRNLGTGLNPQAIETAVIMHETGHILSLVGFQVRPERQDKAHPGHSSNKGSVMYWAVETDDIINAFVGAPPKEFDREDLTDLELIRNS